MNKFSIFIFVLLLSLQNKAYSGVPLPDSMQTALKTVESTAKELSGWYKENVTQIEQAVNEGTKMANSAKEKVEKVKSVGDKVKGIAEKASNAVKDPKAAAQFALDTLSNTEDILDAGSRLQDKFVYEKNITPAQYKKKMEEIHEYENKRAADVYGMALAHRNKLIAEGMEKEVPFNPSSQEEVLRAINIRVPEIVERLNYIQMLEAMTDELEYVQLLSSFSDPNKGDGQ